MQCVWCKGFNSFAGNNERIRCLLLNFTVKATTKPQRTSKREVAERRRVTHSVTTGVLQLFYFVLILLVPSFPSSKPPRLVTRVLCFRLFYSIPSLLAARPGSIRSIPSVGKKRVSKHTIVPPLHHPSYGRRLLTGKMKNQYPAISIPKEPFASSGLLFRAMYIQTQLAM